MVDVEQAIAAMDDQQARDVLLYLVEAVLDHDQDGVWQVLRDNDLDPEARIYSDVGGEG